ncbi:MAG: MarR family winged helix-turn-helix transcriptional regulator, partial [Bdellovibrionota bacterium]
EAEKFGICERVPHPDDRRSYLIQLTSEGRGMFKKVQKIGRATEEEFLKPLNAKEREQLRDFLKRLF